MAWPEQPPPAGLDNGTPTMPLVGDAYHRANYRRARPLVLEADRHRCQLRLPGCTLLATTVDHRTPVVEGGSNHPSNLRAACAHCNSRAGALLVAARRRAASLGPRSQAW